MAAPPGKRKTKHMKKISKILIANRGEIAVRIIRACRELSLPTVAVYSDVDALSLPVAMADEAVKLGPAPPLESYLNMNRLIEAAKATGCNAVHPGYGFLAENAEFARLCRDSGLIFIGPSPEVIEKVGDKLIARRTMEAAKIPIIPGLELASLKDADLSAAARQIGFPLMVKASAGGGGKGMRIVHKAEELSAAVAAGSREARKAFGDETVYLEKFIEKPRHIEFQVLADQHGKVVHLFERECSIQRRHQKIIEETPSPFLTEKLRLEMGETACRVMQAVGYDNAGTVEFLMDAHQNYYFLEVNARIQVEHPITELVTGIDLVKEQIRLAEGQPLALKQEQVFQRGHAIECRVYAEDPANNFFPSIGKLLFVEEPSGPGIRCDSGIRTGMEITHHYDPILSKLIAFAGSREQAVGKMLAALQDYVILGIKTSLPFLRAVMAHPKFQAGEIDTHFISQHFSGWREEYPESDRQAALVAAALVSKTPEKRRAVSGADNQIPSPWRSLGQWEGISTE